MRTPAVLVSLALVLGAGSAVAAVPPAQGSAAEAAGAAPGEADANTPYTLEAVIRSVMARHPEMAVSAFDPAIAATEEQRVEGALATTLDARIGISDDQTPVASDFQPSDVTTAQASGLVTVPLANGASVAASANYSRTQQDFASPFAAQLARINPAYRGGLDLSYRLPLMRGAGRPQYDQGLAAARADTEAAVLQRRLLARSLGLEAMNGYFRLLSDGVSVRLAQVAVERAERLLDYQKFRERFGLIESADRLQSEALLAERRLELQQAEARQTADRVDLNRLMLRATDAALPLAPAPPAASVPVPSLDHAYSTAQGRRPEFGLLEARIAAAAARTAVARDAERRKVDVVAELGTYSLDGNAVDAAAGALDTHDHFVGLSLEFNEVLGGGTAAAERRRAELVRDQLVVQRGQTEFQVRNELAAALTALANGEQTLQLARRRAAAERSKFEAEMKLYREGRSDTATVVQFEGDLHAAELGAELQELTLRLAARQLSWAQGTLFEELGIDAPGKAAP